MFRVGFLVASLSIVLLAGCSSPSEEASQASTAPDLRCDGSMQVSQSPDEITHKEEVTFTVDVPAEALGVVWLLDDLREEGGSLSHVFEEPGAAMVEARALTADGCVLIGKADVDVQNTPPIALLEYRVSENALVLDASASKDPNGDSLTFQWKLDGEQVASGETAVTSVPEAGAIIEVVVTDAFGGVDSDRKRFDP